VKREATALVRLSTEREVFLTTPEHPFATPRSGWTPAGRLVPGDRVVSARVGEVRVVSLHHETPPRPVAVFNLTVDPSHAYLVGTDRVLVHNVRCKGEATLEGLRKKDEELREAQRALEELRKTAETSPEHQTKIQPQIEELKSSIGKIRRSIQNARARLRKVGIDPDAPPPPAENATTQAEDTSTRHARDLEAIELEIAQLQSESTAAQDRAAVQEHIDALKKERGILKHKLAHAKVYESKKRGDYLTRHEQLLQRAEAHYESVKRQHEATQSALRDLDARTPRSVAEEEAAPKRKAELQKALKELAVDLASADQIRTWEREVAEFERTKTGGGRPELEQHINELKAKLAKEKQNTRLRGINRRKRADPERGEELRQDDRARYRRKSYLADSQRRRDPIELMEDELVRLREQPASASRDQRITYLTEAVRTLESLAETRRALKNGANLLLKADARRKKLLDEAKNTGKVDEKIARVTKEQEARKAEHTSLRAHALLLGLVETRRRRGPQAIEDARLRAFEQAFSDPKTVDEQQLRNFEHELAGILQDDSDTLDADFFDAIWREAEAEDAAPQETGHDTSPEPLGAEGSGVQALKNALRAERSAFEMEIEDLIHQHAAQSQALPGPGSSHHAEGVQRLRALEAAHLSLRERWRQQMRNRLDLARQELRAEQSRSQYRDSTVEADLGRQIALLEHEVQHPSL
jgi:hypothetical protein